MRWLVVLCLAIGCATPNDVRYVATYDRNPFAIVPLTLEAVADAGYTVDQHMDTDTDHRILTKPQHLELRDPVDVAFVIVIEYGGVVDAAGKYGKMKYAITVIPRAYDADERALGEDRLPPSARGHARELSDAIRRHLRQFEAP